MHYIQYYTLYIYLLSALSATCIIFNTIHSTFICFMHWEYIYSILYTVHMHSIQYYTLYIYLLHALLYIHYTLSVHLSATCIENTLYSILYTVHLSATCILFNTIHCTFIWYIHCTLIHLYSILYTVHLSATLRIHYIQYYTPYSYLLHAFYSILYTVHLSATCIIFNTIHCTFICYMHYIQYYTLYIYLLHALRIHYIQYYTLYINLLHAFYSILYTVH